MYFNTVHKSLALFEFLIFFSRCELKEKARWRTLLLRPARAPSPRWEAWTRRWTGTGTEMEVRYLIPQIFFWHKLGSVQIYLNFKALQQWTPSWPTWETRADSRWRFIQFPSKLLQFILNSIWSSSRSWSCSCWPATASRWWSTTSSWRSTGSPSPTTAGLNNRYIYFSKKAKSTCEI